MPCGTKADAPLYCKSCIHVPPSEPMATRLMLSTPPATTKSSQPEATFCAAMLTASKPEAQNRLICTPEAVKSQPAIRAASLGSTPPCSPMGETIPITTSSTAAVSKPLRCCNFDSNPANKCAGCTSCKLPSFLPLPRGVRMASYTNAWVAVDGMAILQFGLYIDLGQLNWSIVFSPSNRFAIFNNSVLNVT